MAKSCILSVSGPALLPDEARLLSQEHPWGIILMGRSCVSRGQVRALIQDIWSALGREALIFIDQEGGRVARLKAPEWPRFPAARAYGELFDHDPEQGAAACWLGHRLMAHELASLGIRADYAPVLDLPVAGANDVIGDRAFGMTPEKVISLGRAALYGLKAGGVAGALKHMPGHGRAEADTHISLPIVTASLTELSRDFLPFRTLAGEAPMALTAHIAYQALDPGQPATLSPVVVRDVIRGEIGFEGLLMTDDLGMEALGGTLGSRAGRAIEAGCDIVLHCSGFVKDPARVLEEMYEVASAVPRLTGLAATRARAAEAFAPDIDAFDAEAGAARFADCFAPLRGLA